MLVKILIGNLPPPDPFWHEFGRRLRRERGFIAFFILTLAVAWGFLLIHDNYIQLCRFAELSRTNQITSVEQQAQTLVDFAVMSALEEGRDDDALRIRDVTGPAYVKRQVESVEKRLPPAAHFCEVLR